MPWCCPTRAQLHPASSGTRVACNQLHALAAAPDRGVACRSAPAASLGAHGGGTCKHLFGEASVMTASASGCVVATACSTPAAVSSPAHDAREAPRGSLRQARRVWCWRTVVPNAEAPLLSWYKYEGLRIAKGQALLDWVADNPNLQASQGSCLVRHPISLDCDRLGAPGGNVDGGRVKTIRAAIHHSTARGPAGPHGCLGSARRGCAAPAADAVRPCRCVHVRRWAGSCH